jgi:hypothetical protein
MSRRDNINNGQRRSPAGELHHAKCFNCGLSGHIAAHCTVQDAKSASVGQRQPKARATAVIGDEKKQTWSADGVYRSHAESDPTGGAAQDAAPLVKFHEPGAESYNLMSRHYMTDDKLMFLQDRLPNVRIEGPKQGHLHPHPILNFDREYAEGLAYRYGRSVCQDLGVSRLKTVLDVGGNPSRHARYSEMRNGARTGRRVHSCNPVLSPADVTRKMSHGHMLHTCSHKASECTCVTDGIAFVLSVDSIYYLTPVEVAELCARSDSRLFVAVFHKFDHAFGSFAGGEATYHLTDADTVEMHVEGNPIPYRHSAMGWLRQTHVRLPSAFPRFRSLCWTEVSHTSDHVVYAFTVSDVDFPEQNATVNPFSSVLQKSDYYGRVVAGALSEKTETSVPGEFLTRPTVSVYSWGSWFLVIDVGASTTMLAPKSIVSEAALYCMGRKRNPDVFALLLTHLRHRIKRFNMPAEYLTDAVFSAACLGFVASVQKEVQALYGIVQPIVDTLDVHTEALQFKFKRVWRVKTIAAAAAAGALVVGGTVAAIAGGPATLAAAAGLAVPAAKLAAGVGIGIAVESVLMRILNKVRDKLRGTPVPSLSCAPMDQVFDAYRHDRSSPQIEVRQGPISLVQLPASKPSTSVDELLAIEIDETAQLSVPEPEAKRDTNSLTPCGIVSTVSVPVVAENSAHSEMSGLVERALKQQPYHSSTFDEKKFVKMRKFILSNLDVIFPDFGQVQDDDEAFEKWNNRNPASLQEEHRKIRTELRSEQFNPAKFSLRKAFIKTEKVGGRSCIHGISKFAPRVIQSGSKHYNVLTGPWVYAFQKRLKEVWNKLFAFYFPSGATGEEIGQSFEEILSRTNAAILEGDFSKYDTTIHELLLGLEIELFKRFGAPDNVIVAMRAAIQTVGVAKFDIRYSVEGTRHSGDNQTSCGNTLLQVCAMIFALCELTGQSIEKIIEQIRYFALGDDNLLVAPHNLVVNQGRPIPIVPMLASLGLDLKLKLFTGENARYRCSFLSSKFYPVLIDGVESIVLAPNLGRVYAKYGYYTNVPFSIVDGKRVPRADHARGLVRGDALSRHRSLAGIPFLQELNDTLLRVTEGVTPKHSRDRYGRVDRVRVASDQESDSILSAATDGKRERSERIWEMLLVVYSLTRSHLEQYKEMLDRVTSVPYILDFPPLSRAAMIDGSVPDCCVIDDGNEFQMEDDDWLPEAPPTQKWVPKATASHCWIHVGPRKSKRTATHPGRMACRTANRVTLPPTPAVKYSTAAAALAAANSGDEKKVNNLTLSPSVWTSGVITTNPFQVLSVPVPIAPPVGTLRPASDASVSGQSSQDKRPRDPVMVERREWLRSMRNL